MSNETKQFLPALIILTGLNFINIVDSMMLMPLGDMLMREMHFGTRYFGLLVASYSGGAFIASILGVNLFDRFNRKHLIVIVFSGFILGTFLCSLSPNYMVLLMLRFTTGLFGGVIGSLSLTIVSEMYPYDRRGFAMGILMSSFSLAAAVGVPISLYMAEQSGWRDAFMYLSLAGLIMAILLIVILPSLHSPNLRSKNIFKTIADIMQNKNMRSAIIASVVMICGHFMLIPFISPYFIRNCGLSQSDITGIYLYGGIATVFSAPLIGKLTDLYGAKPMFRILVYCSIPISLLMSFFPKIDLLYVYIVTIAFFVFGSGRLIPPQTLVSGAITPDLRASFMSLRAAFSQLGLAIAAGSGAIIVHSDSTGQLHNYGLLGIISSVLMLICIFLMEQIKIIDQTA